MFPKKTLHCRNNLKHVKTHTNPHIEVTFCIYKNVFADRTAPRLPFMP